jgi:DNA modification methylase
MTLEVDRIYCGDCLDLMREMPDKSVDLVLTDPPYGQILEKYSKPGDLVLDPFLGSGTTAIACLRTGRHYIGIEKHEPYFIMAQERIDKERAQVRLFDALEGVTA